MTKQQQALKIKCHRLSALNHRDFSHSSGGWKSKIKMPTWSGTGNHPALSLQTMPLSSHGGEGRREEALYYLFLSSVQFSSIAQSCPTLCDPMKCSTPGLPVHHQTPGVHPNPCPLSRWCHPTISSSVIPFSSCTQLSLLIKTLILSWGPRTQDLT